MSRLLVFHPTIAPYRIDFFNDLARSFQTRICLRYWNLRDQTFDYGKIYSQFQFTPVYLKEKIKFKGRSLETGYWKQLDDFQPDVVLTEEFGLGTMLVLLHRFFKRKKYKVVTMCDDSYDMVSDKNEHSAMHRWARRCVASFLDDIIVIEPNTGRWYRNRYGKGYFFPIIKREDTARRDYLTVLDWSKEIRRKCLLENKWIFLFVGRLVGLKNVATIIRSFSVLDQRKYKLVIVGEGPEMEHLKEMLLFVCTVRLKGADASGSVVFTVMVSKSFGMILASYIGGILSIIVKASISCKYGTCLYNPQLHISNVRQPMIVSAYFFISLSRFITMVMFYGFNDYFFIEQMACGNVLDKRKNRLDIWLNLSRRFSKTSLSVIIQSDG